MPRLLSMARGSTPRNAIDSPLGSRDPPDPQRLPVQLIDPSSGKLVWLVDAAAAGMGRADDDDGGGAT